MAIDGTHGCWRVARSSRAVLLCFTFSYYLRLLRESRETNEFTRECLTSTSCRLLSSACCSRLTGRCSTICAATSCFTWLAISARICSSICALNCKGISIWHAEESYQTDLPHIISNVVFKHILEKVNVSTRYNGFSKSNVACLDHVLDFHYTGVLLFILMANLSTQRRDLMRRVLFRPVW